MARVYPEPVKFHKRSSQLQVQLKRPSVSDSNEIIRGCMFFEIANAKEGTDRMDWDNKINMKIGVSDIGKILAGLKGRKEIKIYHENSRGNSALNIAEGQQPGTYGFKFSKKEGEDLKSAMIYLNAEDMNVFLILLESGLPQMLGWS
jgi:threonine synthase